MYYITLDLEWNQAYAQKAMAVQKQLCARLRGEVIQIGAVKLNPNLEICGSYSIIVKPKYFKKLHKHVSELTGISQEQMDAGVSLGEAAESFREFCGKDFVFLTWGPDDIPMLKDNFHIHDIPSAWLDATYDLQPIFNRQTDGASKQRSLEYAMEYFNIPQNLPAHDALNDAYFTALVAQKMDIKEGIRTYHDGKKQYLEESVIGDADGGDDGYVTINEMMEDVKNPVCPLCKKPLEAMERPLHSRGQRYTFLFHCKRDGDMFLTLKLHRNLNDTWRAKRTLALATEDQLLEFRHRIEETAIRKKSRSRRSSKKRSRSRKPQGTPAAQEKQA
jgi:DNA polymerase III epsilon subunit-like protein